MAEQDSAIKARLALLDRVIGFAERINPHYERLTSEQYAHYDCIRLDLIVSSSKLSHFKLSVYENVLFDLVDEYKL